MATSITSMALILGIFCGMMGGLAAYQWRRSPHPEIIRKALHVGMGLGTLPLPWLFGSPRPVVGLACVFVIALIALRSTLALPMRLGRVIHGVERKSIGEICFVIGVTLTFILAAGSALLFCVPLLILTLADAAAGLTGVCYGRLQFKTAGGEKTIEGSFAFFVTAFLCVHTSLLLFTEMNRLDILLIALALGLWLAWVEAIASRGLDNLLVPVVGLLLLRAYLAMNSQMLWAHLGTAVVFSLITLLWLRRRLVPRTEIGFPRFGYRASNSRP
ncbi:MAG: hypothetical protein WBP79_02080 [Candidatus Acidiferrales bacterium]